MDGDLQSVPGIGPATQKRLARLGMTTKRDLLFHLPSRYIDRSHVTPIAAVKTDGIETVGGTITGVRVRRTRRRGMCLIECDLKDDSGLIKLVWFTKTYGGQMPKAPAAPGDVGIATGRVAKTSRGTQMDAPFWERSTRHVQDEQHSWPPIPIYPLTEGLTQNKLKAFISWALEHVTIDQPDDLRPPDHLSLPSVSEALLYVHRPRSLAEAEAGRRSLAFSEAVSFYQLSRNRPGVVNEKLADCLHSWSLEDYASSLPFQLTQAQQRAIQLLDALLKAPDPRFALLQGDVGSGKTVVAAFACGKAVMSGFQAAIMAPTRLLAEQHHKTLQCLLAPWDIEVALLTGETPSRERSDLLTRLRSGDPLVVVGTTALTSSDVMMARPLIGIIDEQHRFGVMERQALTRFGPTHILEMTATPIPRSLALVLYSDHEVISLDEKPPGRMPVDTRWIHPKDRTRVYEFLRQQVQRGHLGYVVFPRVSADHEEVTGVLEGYQSLVQRELQGCKVGMIHGQMSSDEQDDIMGAFARGDVQVLCATTVIEVGVDVPQATVMVVEDADRFGLAQLHQLRGRVGRGQERGYALLIADPTHPSAIQKIDILRKTDDGFAIAEEDLALRGPGELGGLRQAGSPAFRWIDLDKDLDLLMLAKQSVSVRGDVS